MNENLKIRLEDLEKAGKSLKPWNEWYDRVKNLVTSAMDVAREHEDWPVCNMLDVVNEMLFTGQGIRLDMFLNELSSDGKEDFCSAIESVRTKYGSELSDIVNALESEDEQEGV